MLRFLKNEKGTSFHQHYTHYLGIEPTEFDGGKRIFASVLRYNAFPGHFFYTFIHTKFNGEPVIALHPDWKLHFHDAELKKLLLHNQEDILSLLKQKFSQQARGFFIKKMFRFSVDENTFQPPVVEHPVELLTPHHKDVYLTRLQHLDTSIQEKMWQHTLPLIQKKRSFIAVDNKTCCAIGNISNIIANGGNIGVGTSAAFRRQGYGQAMVATAVRWCFQNQVVPIYLVDSANHASIALAESLGFQKQASEIVIRSAPINRN